MVTAMLQLMEAGTGSLGVSCAVWWWTVAGHSWALLPPPHGEQYEGGGPQLRLFISISRTLFARGSPHGDLAEGPRVWRRT